MELTTKGFKKPTTGDANDLYQFVGDNMDLLEIELDKKSNVNHTHSELHTHANKSILDATEASYTTSDKNKLTGIEAGAQVNQNAFTNVKVGAITVIADSATDTLEIVAGTNVTIVADTATDKLTISSKDTVYTHPSSHPATMITEDATHRFVTDTKIAAWDAKSNFSGNYADLSGIPLSFPPDIHKHGWNDIAGKPTTFTPSAHTHSYDELTGKPYSVGKVAPVNKNIFWIDTN